MKLLMVTCLKDFQDRVVQIFKESQIPILSLLEASGIKNEKNGALEDDWFPRVEEKMESVVIFSFTSSENAQRVIDKIALENLETNINYPLRGFTLPVETFI